MHFTLTHQLPKKCIVACSGGPDSIAAAHWLHWSHKVEELIYIHHNTCAFSDYSQKIVADFGTKFNIPVSFYMIPGEVKGNKEEYWRDCRYEIFKNHPGDLPIVLAHQLDDCVEEYITCAMKRGFLGTIPYRHGRCIRPFRTCQKIQMENYCAANSLLVARDPTNVSDLYLRGKYRSYLTPWLRENVNPGLESMVRRMIEEGLGNNDESSRRKDNSSRGTNLAAAIELTES